MAGYSGTSLVDKLGIKPGMEVGVRDAPADFPSTLGELPEDARLRYGGSAAVGMVIVFGTRRLAMQRKFGEAMRRIPADGMIWVAWPKRSSGVETDLTEDVMREMFLPTGMVDTKVCAIDDTWSGLRFVVRRENRAAWSP